MKRLHQLLTATHCKRVQETQMYSLIQQFLQDERGATSIEYGLIAAGIGVALITLVGQVGQEITAIFTDVRTQLEGFNGTPTT
jgi:pilus assembly protein Flp/PilA